MQKTPASERKHIVLFGEVNAGKSSLFNALLNQQRAIVSDIPGTTTDPVQKAMELIPYGPVTLVDTAGLFDDGVLGSAREKKTRRWMDMADLALYVIDPGQFDLARFNEMKEAFEERKLPYLTVMMKKDLYEPDRLNPENIFGVQYKKTDKITERLYPVSVHDPASLEALRKAMVNTLQTETDGSPSLIGGLIPSGSVAVLVAPIDSEAPAGRLILPQVQLIRDCLDHGIRCHVTTDAQLSDALKELNRVDLVVTDSQVFAVVDRITPKEIPLTSFSILTARRKGNFQWLYEGARHIDLLKQGDKVLIAEACTHNTSHEDIGRVKLPKLLEQFTGATLDFTFQSGAAFPEDVSTFRLIVHCGGCMLTSRMFASRQQAAKQAGVPFTNYGMALARCSNILERSVAIVFSAAP